jgi:Ser/Thr protein kinase RdoA (MazF antagonist)
VTPVPLAPPPPLPRWFGPRASTDDPAVAALLDQLAPAGTWLDIGGSFNLNIRLDGAEPLVLRVHRPWATRGRVAGLRRLRERLQRAGIRVAQPVPILGRDLVRVGDRWAELEEFVPHVPPDPSQESHLRLFEELGRLHTALRATWQPDLPQPLDDHQTHRQLRYWLSYTRRRLGPGAEPVVHRARLLLDELGQARRGIDLPRAPIHGDYKLGNAVQLPDGSWLNLDLDFVRFRERLYDVAGALYWAAESGAPVDLRALRDAYDRSAPEPVTPDERQFLPAQIALIPLHWVAAAGFTDERIGVPGTVGVSEAERALDAAEGWWGRREELRW